MSTPSTFTLAGKEYPLVWGNLARHRFASLPKEVRNGGGYVPDIGILWSAIAVKPNPFPTWEHVAELVGDEELPKLQEVLIALFPAAEDAEKKTEPIPSPSPDTN